MQTTFLCPGQGSQKAGMGQDLYEKFSEAKARFDQANEILGRDIAGLCFSGPEEELKATQNTQPALFTMEAALTDVLKSNGIVPSYTAGHSLGEYGALYAAGAFSFEDGLRLVAQRGALMAAAGKKKPGAMAAVIGLDVEQIRGVLEKVDTGIVVPANQNSPEQTVISGEVVAVETACELLKEAGAKRAVPLPVSGAFHSPLMQEAADEFKAVLDGVTFNTPACPVVTNVTAQPENDPQKLRDLLYRQLTSPVRWVETVETLQSLDCGRCLEVGPGAVLKGLLRKFAPDVTIVSCGTAENVYSLISPQG
ncbi:MAG: ACP S-malonyltransferase [Chitinivibrionales bacterium]|nr:ACP S-malonyltransferase [Chitinivibrionales bacterium]